MRRLCLAASLALACAAAAQPAAAQVKFGGQAALMTGLEDVEEGGVVEGGDLNGTFGVGPRVELALPVPMLQLGVVGQGVWYFPDGGNYMTYGVGAKLGLSTPVISPYVIGGWQWRRTSPDEGDSETVDGPTVGIGLGLGMIPVFIEATFEFNDDLEGFPGAEDFDNNPLVIQAGVLVGG